MVSPRWSVHGMASYPWNRATSSERSAMPCTSLRQEGTVTVSPSTPKSRERRMFRISSALTSVPSRALIFDRSRGRTVGWGT